MRTTGKKIMVILLSFMMTVSTFITFSFAEEPQGKAQPVEMTETVQPEETSAESTPERHGQPKDGRQQQRFVPVHRVTQPGSHIPDNDDHRTERIKGR